MPIVREFFHRGSIYRHDLDLETDAISLICPVRGVILTYTAHGVAVKTDGSIYGRFRCVSYNWEFEDEKCGVVIIGSPTRLAEGLLDFEVSISNRYVVEIEDEN